MSSNATVTVEFLNENLLALLADSGKPPAVKPVTPAPLAGMEASQAVTETTRPGPAKVGIDEPGSCGT